MMSEKVEIYTERFLLREISNEDVSERYLNWLSDLEVKRYIISAPTTKELSDLKQYVHERIGRDDILFLGIFEKSSGLHIGNIKYEPVNSEVGYAIMGVLIGDPAYRGRGVTTEVLKASSKWLKTHRNIRQILLGVSKDNFAAIKAYQKAGFVVVDTPYIQKSLSFGISMALYL